MAKICKDLVGLKFNRLTVLNRVPIEREPGGRVRVWWACSCECGGETTIEASSLKSGNIQSCGCLRKESVIAISTNRREYRDCTIKKIPGYPSWVSMKSRCLNPEHDAYHNYGGRGITVCDEWLEFSNFHRDMGVPPMGTTLERVDNNRGYSKENCIWADATTQARNRRTNKLTADLVESIRRDHRSGKYIYEGLSKKYCISVSHICNIVNNQRWAIL